MHPDHQLVTRDIYPQLLQLRDKLSVFYTVPCRLMHEQTEGVVEESTKNSADTEPLKVIRKGPCNAAVRRNLLGCAHTIANDTFVRLADNIYETGVLQTVFPPSEKINSILLEVYMMDHERGILEKQKTHAHYRQDLVQAIDIQNTIEEIVSRHNNAIGKLEQIRMDIMSQLDSAIERFRSASAR